MSWVPCCFPKHNHKLSLFHLLTFKTCFHLLCQNRSPPLLQYFIFVLINQKIIKSPYPNLVNNFLNSRLSLFHFSWGWSPLPLVSYEKPLILVCSHMGEDAVLVLLVISISERRPGSEANLEVFKRKLEASNTPDPINFHQICSPAFLIPLENCCKCFNWIHLRGAFCGSGFHGFREDIDAVLVWNGDFPWVKQ